MDTPGERGGCSHEFIHFYIIFIFNKKRECIVSQSYEFPNLLSAFQLFNNLWSESLKPQVSNVLLSLCGGTTLLLLLLLLLKSRGFPVQDG